MNKFALLVFVFAGVFQTFAGDQEALADLVLDEMVAISAKLDTVTRVQQAHLVAQFWPQVSVNVLRLWTSSAVSGSKPSEEDMDYFQSVWLDRGVLVDTVVIERVISKGLLRPLSPTPEPPKPPVNPPPVTPTPNPTPVLNIGNFLAEDGTWTSHVLMSDYLHNGTSPNRGASDGIRPAIIARAKTFGNTIHVYGTNDDNYSRRRGPNPASWQSIPDRRVFFGSGEDSHWFHWFVQCRLADLEIVLWLWSNDSKALYNKESVWTDDKVVNQMTRLISLGSTLRDGAPLVRDFVLKLEADDEWSVPRINRIAARVRPLLRADQRLWYHNQTTDLETLKQVDWTQFHGVRWQFSNRSSASAVKSGLRDAITALPPHLLWVGSEYHTYGETAEARQIGDWILEMRNEFPRIVGVDNAATVERWLK
jgi:hypothetical protein